MSQDDQAERERHYVEEVGLLLEQWGMQRMAGRVLGRLLLCDPPHQSSAELADYLHASRASISTSTRQLVAFGLVQRVPIQRTRASYFAVQHETFETLFHAEIAQSARARELFDRGLDLMSDRSAEHNLRLAELRDVFAFFEREMPALLQRWRTEKEKR